MRSLPLSLALVLLPSAAHAQAGGRFVTDRPTHAVLELPGDAAAYTFAVFGDRTGGPAEGVEVLAEAVHDVNLVGPDLVMTVGDLVEGYNRTPEWLVQMDEFKAIMDRLTCPWFPVAGNHDIYWRGDGAPEGEHEGNYERHFGPLWYAFEHKDAWFVVLYTDESDPETGVKNFNAASSQRMSPEQFAWLERTLEHTADAKHVFVFVHHPRWTEGKYGEDWRRVHRLLVRAGNVKAVFGGHIHYMRYDPKDGIDYYALATVGGYQDGLSAAAGMLHQYHLVTVRDDRLDVVAYPVGAALDPKAITGEVATEVRELHASLRPRWVAPLALAADGSFSGVLRAEVSNPVSRRVTVETTLASTDRAWTFGADHGHLTLEPGETKLLRVQVDREATDGVAGLSFPHLNLAATYHDAQLEAPLAVRSFDVPLDPAALATARGDVEDGVLQLDGEDDCLAVPHDAFELPDGPFTLEAWVRARRFETRQAVLAKTESAEYGFFANDGTPEFLVHVDGAYRGARAGAPLEPGRWHHLAGVFDGAEVRLYVDGARVASTPAAGRRTARAVPLLVGADPDWRGEATSLFEGLVDEVRLSDLARYEGEHFVPATRFEPDEHTVLYLPMTPAVGPWTFGAGPRRRAAVLRGAPRFLPGAPSPEGVSR